MKLIKRITSTMLSMTIIAGAAAADIPAKMTTSAAEPTNSVLLRDTVISEIGKRIADREVQSMEQYRNSYIRKNYAVSAQSNYRTIH